MLLPVTKLSYTCHSLSLWSKKSPQDFILNHRHSVFFCCGKILSVTSTQKILSVTSKQKNRCNCSSVNLKTRWLDKINQFGLDDYFLNFSHLQDQICIIPGVLHRNLSWKVAPFVATGVNIGYKTFIKVTVITNVDFIPDRLRFVFGFISENKLLTPTCINTKWSLHQ